MQARAGTAMLPAENSRASLPHDRGSERRASRVSGERPLVNLGTSTRTRRPTLIETAEAPPKGEASASGDPSGIRTRVTAVRGQRTRPLYDGAGCVTQPRGFPRCRGNSYILTRATKLSKFSQESRVCHTHFRGATPRLSVRTSSASVGCTPTLRARRAGQR